MEIRRRHEKVEEKEKENKKDKKGGEKKEGDNITVINYKHVLYLYIEIVETTEKVKRIYNTPIRTRRVETK